jgi:hypothetical protein
MKKKYFVERGKFVILQFLMNALFIELAMTNLVAGKIKICFIFSFPGDLKFKLTQLRVDS